MQQKNTIRKKSNVDQLEACKISQNDPEYKKLMQMDTLSMLGEIERELHQVIGRLHSYKTDPATAAFYK